MDQKKLTDYLFLIKHLIDSQEALLEYQTRVELMVEMVLANDLIDYPDLKLHVYLRELSDAVGRATCITEDVMGALNEITTLLMNSGEPIFNEVKVEGIR